MDLSMNFEYLIRKIEPEIRISELFHFIFMWYMCDVMICDRSSIPFVFPWKLIKMHRNRLLFKPHKTMINEPTAIPNLRVIIIESEVSALIKTNGSRIFFSTNVKHTYKCSNHIILAASLDSYIPYSFCLRIGCAKHNHGKYLRICGMI